MRSSALFSRLRSSPRAALPAPAPSRARGSAAGAPPPPPHQLSSSSPSAVPRLAILLGGTGLIPFAWYGLQHAPYPSRRAAAAGAPAPRPALDDLLARWARHTSLPLEYLACGDQATVRHRFTAYSATVLSFLGAVHWGAALCGPGAGSAFAGAQLLFGVAPSLLAWGALCAPEDWAGSRDGTARHTLLAAGFLASYFFDEAAAARKPVPGLPPYYTHLRTPLTCAVVLLHCVAGALSRSPSISEVNGGVK